MGEPMTIFFEYAIVMALTLVVEHSIKYFIDKRRIKQYHSDNNKPDRRIWDGKK